MDGTLRIVESPFKPTLDCEDGGACLAKLPQIHGLNVALILEAFLRHIKMPQARVTLLRIDEGRAMGEMGATAMGSEEADSHSFSLTLSFDESEGPRATLRVDCEPGYRHDLSVIYEACRALDRMPWLFNGSRHKGKLPDLKLHPLDHIPVPRKQMYVPRTSASGANKTTYVPSCPIERREWREGIELELNIWTLAALYSLFGTSALPRHLSPMVMERFPESKALALDDLIASCREARYIEGGKISEQGLLKLKLSTVDSDALRAYGAKS